LDNLTGDWPRRACDANFPFMEAQRDDTGGGMETQVSTRTSTGTGTGTGAAGGPRVPDAPPLDPGTIIGSYEVVELIAEGGMGRVYLARHQKLGRKVALKVLRRRYSEDKETVGRFFEEARAVNRIQHAHIIEVTDFIEDDVHGSCYVMELLEGETLATHLQNAGPMPAAEVVRISLQVAGALAAAHEQGIIHRDLKPDNIYLTKREGQWDYVKLLDFGIAKLEGVEDRTAMGTPAYMAPEQLQGQLVDARADVYSLGVVLYEMLSGKRPFFGRSAGELLLKHATERPPPLPVKEHNIPRALETLVESCLAKSCHDRPASATAVVDVLESVREPEPAPRVRKSLIAALIVTIGVSFAIGRSSSGPETTPGPTPPTPAPAPAPLPAEVEVRFLSSPPGAEVRRQGATELLGTTPFTLTLPRADASQTFEFALVDRGTLATSASLAASGDIAVSFPDLPKPPVVPSTVTPPKQPPSQPGKPDKKPVNEPVKKPRDGRAVIIDPFAGE
jgi:serine/threonine-protein kinase